VLLERVESLLEDAVDGFFGLVLRAKIQPLEIARRLTREAEESKIITLNRVYIPNRFRVDLHPQDIASLQAIGPELEAEFQRFVGEWAIDRDYTVNGPIRVTLHADDRIRRSRLKVSVSLDDREEAQSEARRGMGLDVAKLRDELENPTREDAWVEDEDAEPAGVDGCASKS
jgi:hypothetical protein